VAPVVVARQSVGSAQMAGAAAVDTAAAGHRVRRAAADNRLPGQSADNPEVAGHNPVADNRVQLVEHRVVPEVPVAGAVGRPEEALQARDAKVPKPVAHFVAVGMALGAERQQAVQSMASLAEPQDAALPPLVLQRAFGGRCWLLLRQR
jgi:hypothetical protein